MVEPRPDMFPDKEEIVLPDVKPQEPEPPEATAKEPAPPVPDTPPTPPKGFVPYQALDEERRKRKEVEVKLAELEASRPPDMPDDEMSDEGKFLRSELKKANDRIAILEGSQTLSQVVTQFPQLKGNEADFEEFSLDYPGVAKDKVAKLFLNEKGLLVETPARKGLEVPTGGGKPIPTSGMSTEDIKRLREENPRRYIKLLREGKINPDDIK